MAKELPEHKDILNRVISVGDYVAYCESNMMKVGRVDKIHQKMIRIATGREWRQTVNKYSKDTAKLDGPDLTMYLLTR